MPLGASESVCAPRQRQKAGFALRWIAKRIWRRKKQIRNTKRVAGLAGGKGGIRTRGTLLLNGFQDRLLKPLGHLSTAALALSALESYHTKSFLSTANLVKKCLPPHFMPHAWDRKSLPPYECFCARLYNVCGVPQRKIRPTDKAPRPSINSQA